MNPIKEHRLGRIKLPYEIVREDPDIMYHILKDLFVVHVEHGYMESTLTAFHESFEQIKMEGTAIPYYSGDIDKEGNIKWHKV